VNEGGFHGGLVSAQNTKCQLTLSDRRDRGQSSRLANPPGGGNVRIF
jgi:hypothetical protein